jgi:hypothetical protein
MKRETCLWIFPVRWGVFIISFMTTVCFHDEVSYHVTNMSASAYRLALLPLLFYIEIVSSTTSNGLKTLPSV